MIQPGDMNVDLRAYLEAAEKGFNFTRDPGPAAARRALAAETVIEALREFMGGCECIECKPRNHEADLSTWPCGTPKCSGEKIRQALAAYDNAKEAQ